MSSPESEAREVVSCLRIYLYYYTDTLYEKNPAVLVLGLYRFAVPNHSTFLSVHASNISPKCR